jgi:hypothetical protein
MLRLVGIAAKLWFYKNWMYAGLIAALFLLAMLPLFGGQWSPALVAVFLLLPAYMIHQVEEHAGDRFRRFINTNVAHAPNALTTLAVVVVNVPLVWGVDLGSIYLARFVAIGWGLIAVYTVLVNALVHVVAAVVTRAYNPGLVTAVVLFVPLGLWALVLVSAEPGVSVLQHAIGVGFAILVHAVLAAHVLRRARAIRSAAPVAG